MARDDRADPTPTAAEVAAIVEAQLPALAGAPVALLGEGTDHRAFLVGGAHVLRFPRHPDAAEVLAIEARLTAWLAPQLPLAIPCYRHFPGPGSARHFAGYTRLAGTPALALADLDLVPVARCLGEFLRTLHALDVAAAAALGVPTDDDPSRGAWSHEALEDLAAALARGHVDPSRAADLQARLADPPSSAATPRLVHADLAAEHVLVDERGVAVGVIDWSDAMIGDPALDLAGLIHWGGRPMLTAALTTYGDIDGATLERARWFATCRAVADIGFGEAQGRREYIAAGQRALAWLAQPRG